MNESVKNRMSEQFRHAAAGSHELLDHYPFSAATMAFGLGVGVGVLIAMMLTESPREEQRHYAERFGREVLHSLANVLPESLSRRVS